MSDERIRQSIEALRAEIDRLGVGDEDARERLDALIADLERQLGQSASTPDLDRSVQEMIEQFEVEHPRITGVLNDLMVTLSGMGI